MEEETQTQTQTKSSNSLLLIVIVVIVLIGGFILFKSSKKQQVQTVSTTPPAAKQEGAITAQSFEVEGGGFYFKPNEIRVKKDETVRITFTNVGSLHDFSLDEFNVKTKQLAQGESETVEFTADQVGTFEFYCGVGNHRQQGMVGKLIVE